MTTTHTPQAPYDRLKRAVASANSSGGVVSTNTARLLAAAIHEGPSTALGRFAASGDLNLPAATTELWDLPIDDVPADWWSALNHYFEAEADDA
ncbi:MAG: hypothetical protein V9G04_10090 [Nocardioides sp.]|jgi:hypothetical protein